MTTTTTPTATPPPAAPPPAGAPPVPPPPRRPRHRRAIAFAVALGLLVCTTIGAAFLPVPYLTLRPGMVRPVTDQILVEGMESHPPEQSIAYTTVRVGRATLLEALAGWLDDDVDVVPEEVIRGDRDAEESRRYNAQLMDTSKLLATAVALEHLGYEVDIQTSGAVVRQIAADAPAAEVLQLDDVIVAVDGEPVDALDDVRRLLQVGGPGATHRLTVERPPGGDTAVVHDEVDGELGAGRVVGPDAVVAADRVRGQVRPPEPERDRLVRHACRDVAGETVAAEDDPDHVGSEGAHGLHAGGEQVQLGAHQAPAAGWSREITR